jgi:hypothetical protein
LNATVPVCTVCADNVKRNSVAPTFTVELAAGFVLAGFFFGAFFSPVCCTPPVRDPGRAGPSLPSSPNSQRSSPWALPARALPAA